MTGTDEGAALGAASVVLHGLRSIMVAPLLVDGRLLGVVYLDSRVAKGIFAADDVGVLTAITSPIAVALATARAAQLEVAVATAHRQTATWPRPCGPRWPISPARSTRTRCCAAWPPPSPG